MLGGMVRRGRAVRMRMMRVRSGGGRSQLHLLRLLLGRERVNGRRGRWRRSAVGAVSGGGRFRGFGLTFLALSRLVFHV